MCVVSAFQRSVTFSTFGRSFIIQLKGLSRVNEKIERALMIPATIMFVVVWTIVGILTFVPQCEYEDGSEQLICFWDAQSSGNGIGRSFYAIGATVYVYLDGEVSFG